MTTRQWNIRRLFIGISLISFGVISLAGELVLDTGVNSEFVDQKISVKNDNSTINTSNRIVTPFLSANYVARDLNLAFRGNHNYVNRSLSGESATNNYTEYDYRVDYTLAKNLIAISAAGSRGFRSENANSFVLDDFLLNADNLSTVKSDSASANLNLPRGDYFGLSANLGFRKTSADRNVATTNANLNSFNNESYGGSFDLISGEALQGIRAQLRSSTNYSKRERDQDFVRQDAGLFIDIKLYKSLGLAVNVNYENNEIKSSTTSVDGLREFTSIGAGLIWQSSRNRSIEVTWNRSETEPLAFEQNEDQEPTIDNFIGLDVNWRFSERTQFNANFSRRFFGDAGNLMLTHSLRSWRTRLSYNESVETSSRLIASNQPGLLICEDANSSIDECFLSETLEPELDPGQILLPIIEQGFELNDRVILRKQLSLTSAITRRRTTLTLTGNLSTVDEFEIDREFDIVEFNISIGFKISPKTSLRLTQSYSRTEGTTGGEFRENEVNRINIQLDRKLTRRFNVSIGFEQLDLVGESLLGNAVLRGIDGPFTDNRLTLGLRYDFGNRR